jgi:glucose-6-phosphate isomerase
VIWNINPFDQWGVELGKKLADKLVPAVREPAKASDQPTEISGLLDYVERWR